MEQVAEPQLSTFKGSVLSQRSSSNYHTPDGDSFVGARMNKWSIPVTETKISPYQLIVVCRNNKLFEKMAEFISEVVNREGFTLLVPENQLPKIVDEIISGPEETHVVAFELPALPRHAPESVMVYGGGKSHPAHHEDDDEGDEDSDDDSDED
jgi:hypothetical protein